MKVLFITNHAATDASSRYRIYQYLPYLREMGLDVQVQPFTTASLQAMIHSKGNNLSKTAKFISATARRLWGIRLVSGADVTVVHREAFPFGPPLLERAIAKWSKQLVFSFDDALYAHFPYASGRSARLLYRFKYPRNIAPVIRASTAVIAGNKTLAAYAGQYSERVHIIPTAIDTGKYPLRPSGPDPQVITIGWLGSSSTSPYIKLIERALSTVAERYGTRVRFKFVGDPHLRVGIRDAVVKGWALEEELSDLHSFDIGLMPLDDSEWTRGKCAFKALQYLAVGIPVVASPVGAATDVVRDGENGLWATTQEQWTRALEVLIAQPDLRRRLGSSGRRMVEEQFSVNSTLPLLLAVLVGTGRTGAECATRPAPRKLNCG